MLLVLFNKHASGRLEGNNADSSILHLLSFPEGRADFKAARASVLDQSPSQAYGIISRLAEFFSSLVMKRHEVWVPLHNEIKRRYDVTTTPLTGSSQARIDHALVTRSARRRWFGPLQRKIKYRVAQEQC